MLIISLKSRIFNILTFHSKHCTMRKIVFTTFLVAFSAVMIAQNATADRNTHLRDLMRQPVSLVSAPYLISDDAGVPYNTEGFPIICSASGQVAPQSEIPLMGWVLTVLRPTGFGCMEPGKPALYIPDPKKQVEPGLNAERITTTSTEVPGAPSPM
jgi:hypothetical protein